MFEVLDRKPNPINGDPVWPVGLTPEASTKSLRAARADFSSPATVEPAVDAIKDHMHVNRERNDRATQS